MDPALIALIVRLAPVVLKGAADAFEVKEVLSSQDSAEVEAAYRDFTAQRNAVAGSLQTTADDPA